MPTSNRIPCRAQHCCLLGRLGLPRLSKVHPCSVHMKECSVSDQLEQVHDRLPVPGALYCCRQAVAAPTVYNEVCCLLGWAQVCGRSCSHSVSPAGGLAASGGRHPALQPLQPRRGAAVPRSPLRPAHKWAVCQRPAPRGCRCPATMVSCGGHGGPCTACEIQLFSFQCAVENGQLLHWHVTLCCSRMRAESGTVRCVKVARGAGIPQPTTPASSMWPASF